LITGSDNLKEQVKEIVGDEYFEEWYSIVENIINNLEFQKRLYFPHHKNINVFNHSIKVSYDAFIFSYDKNIDYKMCAIAGLLHDFYPYIWRSDIHNYLLEDEYYKKIGKKVKFFKKHGFVHGYEASLNYVKFFPELEDKVITNSIKNHMFPLTRPPRYKVGWVVTYCDKVNALKELIFQKDQKKV
jgi:uncharacterized protein